MTKALIINAFDITGRIVLFAILFDTKGDGTKGLFIACES